MNHELKTERFFDFAMSEAGTWLSNFEYPWQALSHIGEFVEAYCSTLSPEEYYEPQPGVFIHRTAKISQFATFIAPAFIGENTEVRPGAFIRGNVFVGKNCVVGNSTELKNVILFNNVQVPHYNYVGDSILGYKSHMGASSLTSNVKSDKTLVSVLLEDGSRIETGRKKFGAIIGDYVEVGCGAVLNPGTVVGRETSIYPLTFVRGFVKPNGILKNDGNWFKRT